MLSMRRRGMSIYCVALSVIMLLAMPVLAQDGPHGLAREVYDFPRDHYSHIDDPQMNQNYLEWFYYTGIVDDADGNLWGYQITLFQGRPPQSLGQPAYMLDIAISDVSNQRFLHFRDVLLRNNQMTQTANGWSFESAAFKMRYDQVRDEWSFRFGGDMVDSATNEVVAAKLNVTLNNDQFDYYVHSPDGIRPIGECNPNPETLDGYTYYYTHPAMTTAGSLAVGDVRQQIAGTTWYDHQWGNFVQCFLAWDWFSLRLDDGSFIMLFSLLDMNGEFLDLLGLTHINAATGDASYWFGPDVFELTPQREWTHPNTGTVFPLEWILKTPVGTFGIAPVFDYQAARQPLIGIPEYWEGMINVYQDNLDGDLIGRGYLEVVR